ncbi:MAG: hypothetical protein QOK40_2 [Miltoncostaeaceae bacterium]|jgi:hypothetical protein|nr:hypothetical protein [Miltoncostaeaceae bacterium]
MTRIVPLTAASCADLPLPCARCVFWQTLSGVSDEARKARWTAEVEERFGAWGRVVLDGDRPLGVMQYGPARAFPRAAVMPGGPPGPDAALITCVLLVGGDPVAAFDRLALEALADLKARRFSAVEAFALRHPEGVPADVRLLGHHTLLDAEALERLGFTRVRGRGPVSLMRLPLGGLQPAPGRLTSRALERLASRRLEPAPGPA